MEKQGRNEKICILGTLVSFSISAALIRLSGFSVDAAVKITGTLIKQAFVETEGMNTFGSTISVLNYFFEVSLGIVFLAAAFSFLSYYGYKENKKKFGAVLSLIGGVIFFFFLGFTIASFATAIAVFISGYVIVPISNAYGKEFKKWIAFRVGSNSVSRAFFVFNILIALGIFFSTLASLDIYQAEFRSDMKESISQAVMPSVPLSTQPQIKEIIDTQVESALNSPLFTAYIRWLPVITAVGVWGLLEILRFFIPFVAGIIVWILKKFNA